MFRFVEPLTEKRFSLHDCMAEDGVFRGGVLTLYFPNGVWLLPNHPLNTVGKPVRTTATQVQFRLPPQPWPEELPQVSVFREYRRRRVGRELPFAELLQGLQTGIWKLEFLYLFRCGSRLRTDAALHIPRRPWQQPCELELTAEQVRVCWNGFDPQRIW